MMEFCSITPEIWMSMNGDPGVDVTGRKMIRASLNGKRTIEPLAKGIGVPPTLR